MDTILDSAQEVITELETELEYFIESRDEYAEADCTTWIKDNFHKHWQLFVRYKDVQVSIRQMTAYELDFAYELAHLNFIDWFTTGMSEEFAEEAKQFKAVYESKSFKKTVFFWLLEKDDKSKVYDAKVAEKLVEVTLPDLASIIVSFL